MSASTAQLVQAFANRRSIYALGKDMALSQDEVTEIVKAAVRCAPSPHGAQAARVVIAFNEDHDEFWDMTMFAVSKVTSKEKAAEGNQKIKNCFKAGAGTILFFEDTTVVEKLQAAYPHEAEGNDTYFTQVSAQGNAAAQLAVWTALSEAGCGASLQHYSALIEPHVHKMFAVPKSWRPMAQMPFGSIANPAEEKTHMPLDQRFFVRDSDGLLAQQQEQQVASRSLPAAGADKYADEL